MNCSKCKKKNINSANYCKYCGYHFSKEEQEEAKKGTFVWYLEKFDKIKDIITLNIITNNIFFKIGTVLLVLGIGIWNLISYGTNLKILESSQYQVQYNTKLNEYYLLTNKDETKLNLYAPQSSQEIVIEHLDKENNLLEKNVYNNTDNIVLNSNTSDEYYIIKSKDNKNMNKLKMYIYRGAK